MSEMDIKAFNQTVIEEFRANAGKVGGQFAGGAIMILSTTGAKSGAKRENPLVYQMHGDEMIIIASFGGAKYSPPWYHNLVKNPEVSVEVGAERYQARARVLEEPGRTERFNAMAAAMPIFNDYQAKTERQIPVISLTRV
jgi:deazaflavin-dependent oxidoreductase (nitroreductase family)